MIHNTRKLNILHELDLAIKRKTQQRSKDKQSVDIWGRNQISSSMEKRRPSHKSVITKNKSQEKQTLQRNKSPSRKQEGTDKYLFDNENLKILQLSGKKFHNKKMDKLISLINYVLSSADKIIKYVNISNFEAEFAVKLFKSDRDTLLSELEGINVEEIVLAASQRSSGKSQSNVNAQNHALKNENINLKKELMILEAECSRIKQQKLSMGNELKNMKNHHMSAQDRKISKTKDQDISNDFDIGKKHEKLKQHQLKHHLSLKEKQVQKLSFLIRQTIPSAEVDIILENLEKTSKFNLIIFNNPQNHKKKAQLEGIIFSLENEYKLLLQEIVNQFKEREDAIRLMVQKIPDVLEQEIPDINLDDLRLVELLELLLQLIGQTNSHLKQNQKSRGKQFQQAVGSMKQHVADLSKQNNELKKQLQTKKEHVPPSELVAISKQNDGLRKSNEQMCNRLKELCISGELSASDVSKMDFDKMILELDSLLNKKRKDSSKQLEDLITQKAHFEETIQKLKMKNMRDHQEQGMQMKQLKVHLESLEMQNKQLEKHRLQSLQARKAVRDNVIQLSKLTDKIRDLESKIKDSQEVAELNKALNNQVSRLQIYEEQCNILKDAIDQLEESIKKQKGKYLSLSEDHTKLKNYRINLEEQLRKVNNQMDLERQQRTIAENDYKEKVARLSQDLNALRIDTDAKKEEINRLKDQTIHLSKESKDKSKVLQDNNKQLSMKVLQLQKVEEQLEAFKNAKTLEIDELANSLKDDMESKDKKIEILKIRQEQLEKINQVFDNELKERQIEIQQLNREIEDNVSKNQEIEDLKQKISTVGTQVETLSRQLMQSRHQSQQLKKQRQAQETQIERLEKENNEMRIETLKYREQVVNIKESKSELNRQQIVELEHKIQSLHKIIERLTIETQQKSAKIQLMTGQKDLALQKQDLYEQQLSVKNVKIEEMKNQLQKVTSERDMSTRQNTSLNEKIILLEQEAAEKEEQMHRKDDKIAHLKDKQEEYVQMTQENEQRLERVLEENKTLFQKNRDLNLQIQEIASAISQDITKVAQEQDNDQLLKENVGEQKSQMQKDSQYNKASMLDQLNRCMQQLKAQEQKVRENEQKLQNLFSTNTKLLSENEMLYLQNQELEQKVIENEASSQELKDLQAKVEILTVEKYNLEIKVKQEIESRGSVENEIISLRQQVASINQQKGSLHKQNQELKQQSNLVKKQKEDISQKLSELTRQFNVVNEQEDMIKSNYQLLEGEKDKLYQQNSIMKSQNEAYKTLKAEYQILKRLNAELSEDTRNSKEEKLILQQEKQQKALMVSQLNEKLRDLMQKSQKRISKFQSQILQLTSENQNKKKLSSESKPIGRESDEPIQLKKTISFLHSEKDSLLVQAKTKQEQITFLSLILEKVKQQMSELQNTISSLNQDKRKDLESIKSQQAQIISLKQQLENMQDLKVLHASLQQKYDEINKAKEQSDHSRKLTEMAQEHRMNLVKMIVKKIIDADVEYHDIDELLQKATTVVRQWKQNQAVFNSANKLTQSKQSFEKAKQESIQNKSVGLSGFGDPNVSQLSNSLIDQQSQNNVPPLNFEEMNREKQDSEREIQAIEPVTSIQNRLMLRESGRLHTLVKTQESINEVEQQVKDEQMKSDDKSLSYQQKEKEKEEFKNEKMSQEQDESAKLEKKLATHTQLDDGNAKKDNIIHPMEKFVSEKVQKQQTEKQKSFITQDDHASTIQEKDKIDQQVTDLKSKQNQEQQTVQYQSNFDDFKDPGDTSQLDQSNIQQNLQRQTNQASTLKVMIQDNILQKSLNQQRSKVQVQIQNQQQQSSKQIEVQQNDFSDFKDANTSQLDNSNIISKEDIPEQQLGLLEAPYIKRQLEVQQFQSNMEIESPNKFLLQPNQNCLDKDKNQINESKFVAVHNEPSMNESLESDGIIHGHKQNPNEKNEQSMHQKQMQLEFKNKEKQNVENQVSIGDFADANQSQQLSRSQIYQTTSQPRHQDKQHGLSDFGSVHQSLSQSQIQQAQVSEKQFQDFHNQLQQSFDNSKILQKTEAKQSKQERQEQGFGSYLDQQNVTDSIIIKKER